MKNINEVLRKNNIGGVRYLKKGKCTIIDSKENRYVIKPNKTKIYDYLNYRNFHNYPNYQIDEGYEISEYIEDVDIPREQKMIDLVSLVASLHKKTTYYKKIDDTSIKEIYDDLKKELNEIQIFYDNLIEEAETSIYMSPSHYLLARNISFVYSMIELAHKNIDKWYSDMKDKDRFRVAIIHNNLKLEHFINNTLISWDKSKIGIPIIDLYILYKTSYNEYDWQELIDIYNSIFPLKDDEIFLFNTLIAIPLRINMTSIEIDNVKEVSEKLNYLKLTHNFLITTKYEIEEK